MSKTLLAFTVVWFAAQLSLAQDNGATIAKNADAALSSYNLDPLNNSAKLSEAMTLIEQALKTPEGQASLSAWLIRGNVYNSRLQSDRIKR